MTKKIAFFGQRTQVNPSGNGGFESFKWAMAGLRQGVRPQKKALLHLSMGIS